MCDGQATGDAIEEEVDEFDNADIHEKQVNGIDVLPYAISALVYQDIEYIADGWTQIYDADILQFAALAFIFFSIVLALKMKPWLVVVTATVITGVGMLLNSFIPEVDSNVLQAITGLFWGSHEGSYFPFTSWILYPAVGYAFAYALKRTSDKKKLYLTVSPIGAAVYLIMTFILLNFFEWDLLMDGEYYYTQNIFGRRKMVFHKFKSPLHY